MIKLYGYLHTYSVTILIFRKPSTVTVDFFITMYSHLEPFYNHLFAIFVDALLIVTKGVLASYLINHYVP